MLTIQDILQKADELILEVQENSITPPRVGELIYGLAELIQQGAAGGTTIGIRKLSELEDVELAGLKNLNILQLLGEKWRNVEFDIVKLQAMAGYFNLDDDDNLFTTYNLYSTKEISAFGAGTGSGGGGGGSMVVWGTESAGAVPLTVEGVTKTLSLASHAHSGYLTAETDPTVPAHVKAITALNISTWNAKEPAITKLTAFNKNFGTTAGTVSEGNHTHDDRYKMWYRDQGIDVDANRKENTYLSAYRWINTPVGGIGILETNNQYSNDWVTQEFTLIGSQSRKFIRSFYGGTTWGDWFEFWHSGNLTSLSQLTDNIGVASHIANKTNPHSVTKAQIGLGNVDNTSDAGKPISTATQTALNLKLNKSIFDDLFEKVEVSTGVYAIKAKYNFYSVGEVSAYGAGSGTGGGGGSMVVWGTESAGAVPLTVEGVTKSLSLALHTHSGYLTGNQTITVSGDATGSGTTSIALTLANSGVVAGTYNNSATQVRPFTVDSKGRITNIGTAVTITPAWGSITGTPTTLAGYGITGLTTNYLTKWNGTTIVNSSIFDNGTNVKIGGVFATPNSKLQITGGWLDVDRDYGFRFSVGDQVRGSIRSNSSNEIRFSTGSVVDAIVLADSGFVGISTTTPTATLDVNGIGKFKDDILMTFNTWSYNNWTYPTDKNSMKKFLNLFDIDTAGNLVVKTNLYSTGEVTAYSTGTGVSGLKLQGDMNANGKRIYNVSAVESVSALFGNDPLGLIDGVSPGLFDKNNETIIAAYSLNTSKYIYGNGWMTINNFGLMTAPKMESGEFKFGSWTFKQDGSGRLGIYNGTSEVACFNTDGTYVNL